MGSCVCAIYATCYAALSVFTIFSERRIAGDPLVSVLYTAGSVFLWVFAISSAWVFVRASSVGFDEAQLRKIDACFKASYFLDMILCVLPLVAYATTDQGKSFLLSLALYVGLIERSHCFATVGVKSGLVQVLVAANFRYS